MRPSPQTVDVSTAELWFVEDVEAARLVHARAQEFVAAIAFLLREVGAHRIDARRDVRDARETQDERPHEQQERAEARHRIARQADEKRLAAFASASPPRRTAPNASGLPGFIAICHIEMRPSASTAGFT